MTETYEHQFLKEVALIWLSQQGYPWLGTEIDLWWPKPTFLRDKQCLIDEFDPNQLTLGGIRQTWHERHIIDCVGIKKRYCSYTKFWACGIEAKVDREDLLSGFCYDKLNLHYIIAPKNVIPKSILPSRVGLLEVDKAGLNEWGELVGVKITKRPRATTLELKGQYTGESILEQLIETMCRHISTSFVRNLKDELPYKRKPDFQMEKLPEIRRKGV